MSICTLRPSIQPSSRRPCTNASMRACPSLSSAAKLMSTPIRRIRSGCCARAANGHAAAALPRRVMNSRRCMCPRVTQGMKASTFAKPNVRFGSKADIRTAKSHVRFSPESGLDWRLWPSPVLQRRPTRRLITKWSANQKTRRKVSTLRKVEQQSFHDLR